MIKIACQNIKYYVFLSNYFPTVLVGSFLVAQTVKNLPAMQETQVQSLDWEDRLEKRIATHSSILILFLFF